MNSNRAIVVITSLDWREAPNGQMMQYTSGVASFVHEAFSTESLLDDMDKMKATAERRGHVFDYTMLSVA